MRVGAEYIEPFAEMRGALVKTRWRSASVPDGAVLLGRPESEGLNANDMVEGWYAWQEGRTGLYEVGNEPNHPNHLDMTASRYEAELRSALARIPPHAHPTLLLPGLVPYRDTAEWAAMYDRVQADYNVGRAAHAYWQGRHNIASGVHDAIAQCSGRTAGVWVTEFGDSGNESEAQRVENCIEAVRQMADAGFAGAVRFCEGRKDGDWGHFVFSEDDNQRIIAAGQEPGVPPIRGGADMPEYAVGDGIAKEMVKQGDEPASNEWYPIPGLALAAGVKGLYVYTPKGGTRALPFK